MLMYHGTSARYLQSILDRGLTPRMDGDGNWSEGDLGSRKTAVYLTNSYSLHFAIQAASGEDMLIVEVDLEDVPEYFRGPDEDFLEQATRGHPDLKHLGESMEERTRHFASCDWFDYCHLWKESIKNLGTCCVQEGVPRDLIQRYAIIPRRHPIIYMSDCSITLMNYAICGPYYRNLSKFVFGDLDFEPDVTSMTDRLQNISRDGIRVIPRDEKFMKMKA